MNTQVTFDLPPLPDSAPQAPAIPPERAAPTGMRPGDEKLYVVFYPRTVIDGVASKEHGRPIYHEVDFIRIHVPGDRFTTIDKKVTDVERGRFPMQWSRYSATKQNSMPDGMPLAEWPAITRSQAEELRHFNVHTVEQLSTLADQFGQRFAGFFDLRRKAQAYLAQAKDDAFAAKVAVENDELKARIAQQEATLKVLSERIESMNSSDKEPSNADHAPVSRSGRK
jgi:hypothetical protein